MGMDTYREFTELNERWDSGDAPWKVWRDEPAADRANGGRPAPVRVS
jgi:hypothetical protein